MFILFGVLLFSVSIYLVALAPQLYIAANYNGISIDTHVPQIIPNGNITIGIPGGNTLHPSNGNVCGVYTFSYNGITLTYKGQTYSTVTYVSVPAGATFENAYINIPGSGFGGYINPAPIIYNGTTYELTDGQNLYLALVQQGAIRPSPIAAVSLTIVLLIIVFAIDIFIIIKAARRMGIGL